MACPVHCHLFQSPCVCRAKSRMLCMSMRGFLDLCHSNPNQSPAHTVRPPRLPLCVWKSSQRITHLSHPSETVWQPITFLPHLIGTVWQSNNNHSHIAIWHINWTSVYYKYMFNPLVFWECADGPSGSPMDPENPGYKLTTISIVFLKTIFVYHCMGA